MSQEGAPGGQHEPRNYGATINTSLHQDGIGQMARLKRKWMEVVKVEKRMRRINRTKGGGGGGGR